MARKDGLLPPGIRKHAKKSEPIIEIVDFHWDDGLINPIVEILSSHQLTLTVRNPTNENFLYSVRLISDAFPAIASNMRPKKMDTVSMTTWVNVGDNPGVWPIRLVAVEAHQADIAVVDLIIGTITLQLPPPPPVLKCTPGETRCQGYDLYRCTDDGEWVVSPFSPLCGYVPPAPPPEPPEPIPPTPEPEPLPPEPLPPAPEPPVNGGYEEPPMEICIEGAMSCDGYSLYECREGVMVLTEENSPTCGYPMEEVLAEEPTQEWKTPLLIGVATITGALLVAGIKSMAKS